MSLTLLVLPPQTIIGKDEEGNCLLGEVTNTIEQDKEDAGEGDLESALLAPSSAMDQDETESSEAIDFSSCCIICLEPFEVGQTVMWAKESTSGENGADIEDALQERTCRHVFHDECLMEWLVHSNVYHDDCPSCRQVIVPSILEEEDTEDSTESGKKKDEPEIPEDPNTTFIMDESDDDDEDATSVTSTSKRKVLAIVQGLLAYIDRRSSGPKGHVDPPNSPRTERHEKRRPSWKELVINSSPLPIRRVLSLDQHESKRTDAEESDRDMADLELQEQQLLLANPIPLTKSVSESSSQSYRRRRSSLTLSSIPDF